MAIDYETYAFSFSHAIVKLNETQFTAISAVSFSQDVERAAVYGTDRKPLKRSAGQLSLGEGTITFSDLEEGMSFYSALGDEAERWVLEIAAGRVDPIRMLSNLDLSVRDIVQIAEGFNACSASESASEPAPEPVPLTKA